MTIASLRAPVTITAAAMVLVALALAGLPSAHGAIRSVGKHKGDYLPAHNFKIEIDGIISGGFKEISGLESEIEVIEYKDGDDSITHKRPGKVKYGNIVLKRGVATDTSLLEWYKKVLAGKTDRKSGSIIYLDREGNEVLRYKFFEAWPCKWSLPTLSNDTQDAATEEIELCVEKVERA